jgi:hypothetical protein
MFFKGYKVIIKPEWRNLPDSNIVYEISEWNIDRGFMFPINWREMGFAFAPTELVLEQMIEKAELDR